MIRLIITCDKCGTKEQVEYTVNSENDVYRRVKESGFRYVNRQDNTKIFVGPECYADYEATKAKARADEKKAIGAWFESNKD